MEIFKMGKEHFAQMKEMWSYTHSIGLLFRFINIGFLGLIQHFFGMHKWYKGYIDQIHEYLFTTPFGKYLCSTFNEYFMMQKDYEKPIGDYVKSISEGGGEQ